MASEKNKDVTRFNLYNKLIFTARLHVQLMTFVHVAGCTFKRILRNMALIGMVHIKTN